VAEAKDGVRELGDDRRINRGIEAVRGQEGGDIRLHGACELFEYEVLYCISVGNFAARNRRSPSHTRVAGFAGTAATEVVSH